MAKLRVRRRKAKEIKITKPKQTPLSEVKFFDEDGKEYSPKEAIGINNIDLDNLHYEAMTQSDLLHKWGDRLAIAKYQLRTAIDETDLVEKKLMRAVRAKPEDFGAEGVTKDAVEAVVHTQQEYLKALENQRIAQYRVDKLTSIVTPLEHRKSLIGYEKDLWINKYWSSADFSKEVYDALEHKTRNRVNEELDEVLLNKSE